MVEEAAFDIESKNSELREEARRLAIENLKHLLGQTEPKAEKLQRDDFSITISKNATPPIKFEKMNKMSSQVSKARKLD